jgi:hypothetical protein
MAGAGACCVKSISFGAYVKSLRYGSGESGEDESQPIRNEMQEASIDIEAITNRAYRLGYDEGYSSASAEYEDRIAKQQEAEIKKIEAARNEILVREASVYKRRAVREFGEMRHEIETQIMSVLISLFGAAIERRASEETVKMLQAIIDIRKVGEIRLCGAQKYIDAISEGLGAAAQFVSFEVADQPDVSVKFEQTTIDTQISLWKEKLDRLLEVELNV